MKSTRTVKHNSFTTSEKAAKLLLDIEAIILRPQKPFKFVSGILSPIYTDCRLLMSYPKQRHIVRDLLKNALNKTGKFDVLAGTATAGIPHAAFLAEKMNLPMVYVRGNAKSHGRGNQIEGLIKKGQRVAVIEDLISTGESSSTTVKAVRANEAKANYIFSIMTYHMKKSKENFKSNRIKLVTLTDMQTVVDVAAKLSYIKDEDKQLILDWAKDPPGWGKKNGFE